MNRDMAENRKTTLASVRVKNLDGFELVINEFGKHFMSEGQIGKWVLERFDRVC